MNKVYIVDGNSLLFRAYFATLALSGGEIMRAHDGTPTNVAFPVSNPTKRPSPSLRP